MLILDSQKSTLKITTVETLMETLNPGASPPAYPNDGTSAPFLAAVSLHFSFLHLFSLCHCCIASYLLKLPLYSEFNVNMLKYILWCRNMTPYNVLIYLDVCGLGLTCWNTLVPGCLTSSCFRINELANWSCIFWCDKRKKKDIYLFIYQDYWTYYIYFIKYNIKSQYCDNVYISTETQCGSLFLKENPLTQDNIYICMEYHNINTRIFKLWLQLR